MSIQNIMWTALPNGLNAAGDRLKLSILVSPRLMFTRNGYQRGRGGPADGSPDL